MIAGIVKRRGQGDFVRGNFPEPHNPIYQVQPNWDQNPGMMGLEEFVLADFPEPYNPIYPDNHTGIRGMGCGAGCGCATCGMGAFSVPTWAMSLPSPLNTMAGPLPVVYWIGGGVAALIVLPMLFKKGRR